VVARAGEPTDEAPVTAPTSSFASLKSNRGTAIYVDQSYVGMVKRVGLSSPQLPLPDDGRVLAVTANPAYNLVERGSRIRLAVHAVSASELSPPTPVSMTTLLPRLSRRVDPLAIALEAWD
jgi:hypothetical protein